MASIVHSALRPRSIRPLQGGACPNCLGLGCKLPAGRDLILEAAFTATRARCSRSYQFH